MDEDLRLIRAARNGDIYEVRRLLNNGANPNGVVGYNPLIEASTRGHVGIVRLLLDEGANVNNIVLGTSALLTAARNGNTDVVKLLIDRGASLNAVVYGHTALTRASEHGHINVVRFLLEKGAEINQATVPGGKTPLMLATDFGNIDLVRLLLERGARRDILDSFGRSAYMIAYRNGDSEIGELLEKGICKQRRLTSDWMEICSDLGEARLNELRDIVKRHVVASNFARVKVYFDYFLSSTLSDFQAYISTLSKRRICTGLAKYYEALKPTYQHGEDCLNDSSISGDEITQLPPERLIKLEQNGVIYCFDVVEVASFNGINPYNRKALPPTFVSEAFEKARFLPKDIHELKQRGKEGEMSLKDEVVALQDRADSIVPYFPRRKFALLTSKRLQQLATRLAEYDTDFDLSGLKREVEVAEKKDRLLVWKRRILKRLIVHPEALGNLLEF